MRSRQRLTTDVPTDGGSANSLGRERARHSGDAISNRLMVLVCVCVYAATLHYGYMAFVAPSFDYAGLGYRSPDVLAYAAMLALTALTAISLPLQVRRPSDFVLWMLFCLAAAPSILISQYNSRIPPDQSVLTGLAVALTMVMIRIGAYVRIDLPAKVLPRLPQEIVWLGLMAASVITDATLIMTSGIAVTWLPLNDVYAVRSDFEQFYTSLPALGYLVPIASNVINPVFMARGVIQRLYVWLGIGAVGQYVLYVTTGNKVILFSIPAVLGLSLLFRGWRVVAGRQLLLAVSIVAAGTLVLDTLFKTTAWTSLILRRFLIVPGALTAGYVTVFLNQPKTHFADSPLKWLDSPYGDLLPSFLVGTKFVGDPTTNANASLFGHGFAAYGYAGMFIEGLALVPVLWLLDITGRGLPPRLFALTLLMPCVSLASASVFTAMLTHGVLAAALVLALLPRQGWQVPEQTPSGFGRTHLHEPAHRGAHPRYKADEPSHRGNRIAR